MASECRFVPRRPTDELQAIAKRFGAPLLTLNVRWPGVSGGSFVVGCRVDQWGLPTRVMANEEWLNVEIERPTSICFAAPIPDRVLGANRRLGTFAGMDVFTPSFPDCADAVSQWLERHAAHTTALIGRDGGRVLVALNRSVFVLRPIGVEEDLDRLESLIALTAQLPCTESSELVTAMALPDQLSDLSRLAETWAVSDDDRRGDMIAVASDADLAELWDAVSPRLEQIDTLLAAGATNDLSTAGDLAQAALEAESELRRRRS